jgi:hypothetical protein
MASRVSRIGYPPAGRRQMRIPTSRVTAMTTLGPRVDAAQLRVVLQRLTELDAEVHGVTDTVLDYLPYVDAGAATETLADVGNGLVDAFALLADRLSETERLVGNEHQRPQEIDLTAMDKLDRAVQ